MTDLEAIALTAVSTVVSGGASWFFSRMYYRKSLANQAQEASREHKVLIEALKTNSAAKDEALTMQQYIDSAAEAWRVKGTAVPYIDSLEGVTREQKARILRAASLRHKGREPKRNPYANRE